jgi:hypothetical protein
MNRTWRTMAACSWLLAGGLTFVASAQTPSRDAMMAEKIVPTGFGEAVDRDITRARTATAPFKTVDAAMAAGYTAQTNCVSHPSHGAMGLHYPKPELRDDRLDPERPEILTYTRLADGTLKLTGVEYLVPLSAWTKNEPPTLFGQQLKRADSLGIWYLHAWIWEPNPSGLFADWNPRVNCGTQVPAK